MSDKNLKTKEKKKISQQYKQQQDIVSSKELSKILYVVAKENNTTLAALLRKLDRVSGNLKDLSILLSGDNRPQWTDTEDNLLNKNQVLLKHWKGEQRVQLRKKYLYWQP